MQMTVKFHRHILKMQIVCDDKVIFMYYFSLLTSSIFCLSEYFFENFPGS